MRKFIEMYINTYIGRWIWIHLHLCSYILIYEHFKMSKSSKRVFLFRIYSFPNIYIYIYIYR